MHQQVRAAAALLTAATSLALTGCGQQTQAAPPPAHPPAVTEFNENGVTVRLSVSDWDSSRGTLVATFTPDEAGFHLYSTALPAAGVEGVGRPTRVAATGALAGAGAITADAAVKEIHVEGVRAAVPVYPDGPVTTRLPIRAAAPGGATLLVSYASCSTTQGCTIPVADRPVRLRATADHLSFTG